MAMSKALAEFYLVRWIRQLYFQKLCYMNFPCVPAALLWLIIEFRIFGMRFLNISKYNDLSYVKQISLLF